MSGGNGAIQSERLEETLFRPPAVKSYTSLAAMSEDLTLFTPALVCVLGRFPRDPVAEFLRVTDVAKELQPMAVDVDWPMFRIGAVSIFRSLSGEYQVDWSRRLYAIPHEAWPACRDFIVKLAVYAAEDRFYAEMAYHTLRAVDVVALHTRSGPLAELPRVGIESFAVSSNQWLAHLVESADATDYLPRILRRPPVREVVETANRLLGDTPQRLDERLSRDQ